MRADATELGRAQRASNALLKENELLLEREKLQSSVLTAVLATVPQAIAILDSTEAILSVNPQFAQLFVSGDLPVEGRHIAELLTIPDCLAAVERSVASTSRDSHAETRQDYCSVSVNRHDQTSRARRVLVILGTSRRLAVPRIKAISSPTLPELRPR